MVQGESTVGMVSVDIPVDLPGRLPCLLSLPCIFFQAWLVIAGPASTSPCPFITKARLAIMAGPDQLLTSLSSLHLLSSSSPPRPGLSLWQVPPWFHPVQTWHFSLLDYPHPSSLLPPPCCQSARAGRHRRSNSDLADALPQRIHK